MRGEFSGASPLRALFPSLHKVISPSTLELHQIQRYSVKCKSFPERSMGPGLCSDIKQGYHLDPKVENEEEVQDSLAGAIGSVEGHSQAAVGNSPVTWFSPALSKTALRICTKQGHDRS